MTSPTQYPEPRGWQPIETAPRDGTPILIQRPTAFDAEERWHVVRWGESPSSEYDYWLIHDGKFDHDLRGPEPTHWMPLPPAPGLEQQPYPEREGVADALHPKTADLVDRFAAALKAKLAAAERKYGYTDGWAADDWRIDLQAELIAHVYKGDPRDVAAYCAFAWHHGWSTSSPLDHPSLDGETREKVARLIKQHPAFMAEVMDEQQDWLAGVLADAILSLLGKAGR